MDGPIAICPDCHYDRAGLGDRHCPECGSDHECLDHVPAKTPPTAQLLIAMGIFLSPAPFFLLFM